MRRALLLVLLLPLGVVAFDYAMPHTAARQLARMERWASELSEARVSVAGFDLVYLHGGDGEPLLLIHGFGADKDHFTRVARSLTAHYRVVIPDLPGFGESSKPGNVTYTIPEQVERVRAFAQQLGLQRLHLGGSSMGGYIALAWAAKYPDEVASLWLLAPAGVRAALDTELARRYQHTGEILLLARNLDDFERVGAFVMAQPPWLPHSVKRVLAERAAADHDLHAKIFAQLGEPHSPLIDSYVTRLDTPALIVWGTEDRALNPKGAAALQALMPRAQVTMMEGIGHLPMIEATEATATDYLRFRGELAGP